MMIRPVVARLGLAFLASFVAWALMRRKRPPQNGRQG